MAAHRYWRVYVTNVQATSTTVSCAELQLRIVSGGASVATGGTALASQSATGLAAASAFDGNLATYWQTTSTPPQWIGYDFGSGNAKDIVEFTWTSRDSSGGITENPKDCQLEWSDDGTTWYPSYPAVSIPAWTPSQTRTYTQPNTSSTITASPSAGNFLFIGGELEDFILNAQSTNISFYTSGAGSFYRLGYARGAVSIAGPNPTYSMWANFTASTQFAVTVRCYGSVNSGHVTTPFLTLGVGANARLRLRRTTAADVSTLTLEKFDGTTATSLAVSIGTYTMTTLHRFDVLVDSYGASGRVRVFINNAPYIDTGTMDITAAGATALDRLTLSSYYNTSSFSSYWSECIVATEDTRSLNLLTLAPNGLGDVNTNVSGGWAEIDDTTGSDLDLAVADTAGQALSVHTSGAPTGASGYNVRAVKVMTAAARGSTGPSRLAFGVRTNGTNALASGVLLDTGYSNNSATYATNPVTGAAFTAAELDLLQLAFRADT
jgi:hypothetical protein